MKNNESALALDKSMPSQTDKAYDYLDGIDDGGSDVEEVYHKEELVPENANAAVLANVYIKEGEDFLKDVCDKYDRELIRCLPNITQPEYTEILVDLQNRKQHFELISKMITKVIETHKNIVRTEATQLDDPMTQE